MRNIARPTVSKLVFSSSAATSLTYDSNLPLPWAIGSRGRRAMSRPLFKIVVLVAGIAAVGGWLWLLEIGISWLIAKL